jgi:tetratricopeptide (TPR) repeat protein
MRVIARWVGVSVLGCTASGIPQTPAVPSSPSADAEAGESHLAVAWKYTRLGDGYVNRCQLDAAQQAIGRALDIYERFLPSAEVGYAEALGARSHLREQLHDEAGAALDLSRSIEILSKHQLEARPALLGAYAELVTVYKRSGRQQEAKKAVDRSIDLALRGTLAPGRNASAFAADYDGVVVLADRYARVADAASVAAWDAKLNVSRWSVGDPWDDDAPAASPVDPGAPSCRATAGAQGAVADAESVVDELRTRFQECYQKALWQNPDSQGALRVTSHIAVDGRVSSSRGVGIGLGSDTYQCVTRAVLGARFAPPKGGPATLAIPVVLVQEPAELTSSR